MNINDWDYNTKCAFEYFMEGPSDYGFGSCESNFANLRDGLYTNIDNNNNYDTILVHDSVCDFYQSR